MPGHGNKLQPYWELLLDRQFGPDPRELEVESKVMHDWSRDVLERARLGAGQHLGDAERLEQLADAARLLLFTEQGTPEEFQAAMNLAHVMASGVDRQSSLRELKGLVLSYKAPGLGWWKRLLFAVEFVFTGAVRYPLKHEAYLEDFVTSPGRA